VAIENRIVARRARSMAYRGIEPAIKSPLTMTPVSRTIRMSVGGEQIAEDVPREATGSGGTRRLVEDVRERPRRLLGQLTEPELPPLAVAR
jgi:hypothetical protein